LDVLLAALRAAPAAACVFNCQMGKGRTTTGMVVACLARCAGATLDSAAAEPAHPHEPALRAVDALVSLARAAPA
jgi:protein tyrosine/serine phosphatase